MLRRITAHEVNERLAALEVIRHLGRFDAVLVDVDNTLVPDRAPADLLRTVTAAAQRTAAEAGVGRLLVISNAPRDRAIGAGIVWQVNKPFTRRSRLGLRRRDSVAVIGDRILVDGVLAWRLGATFLLRPWSPERSVSQSGAMRWLEGWMRERLLNIRPFPADAHPMRWLVRMERSSAPDDSAPPSGVTIHPWDPARDRGQIPEVYAAAFGREPWRADWDAFEEFDRDGVFVAESGPDGPIGFAICFGRDDHGYISVVAVAPGHRRRGIASALVHRAITHLRELGHGSIRIDAYLDAAAAVETYRSLGFEAYSVVEDPEADPRGPAEA